MSIAIISHPDCSLHEMGLHPERPERVLVIQKALENYSFATPVEFFEAPLAEKEVLTRVHDPDFVDWIFSIAPKEGYVGIDADTTMNAHTLRAALLAAGACVFAVDLVMQNKAQVAFCNIRPPGHHAERDKAMGFCFFNNVAIAAQYSLDQYQLERIAIIDFDVHHGNGTQHIFQNEKHILYCSSFEDPLYPGYDPSLDNEHLLAAPLKAGTNGELFRSEVERAWFDKLLAFKPQLIFFSAGFDAHQNDLLANINLTKEDYVWITQEIAKIANTCCEGKIISVLEGGYDLEALADCVPAHVDAMVISAHKLG